MANPAVLTTFVDADPNAAPITINDLIALLRQLVSSAIQGSYIPYVIQHDTPGVDDRDKAWIELDTGGRPISIKVWYAGNNGNWRRIYNGMVGEIRGYSGNPSLDFDMDGNNPGRGKIGGIYDGWYLCNGLNGTPNMSDKFLLGGHMDNSAGHNGYSNGWQAAITSPEGSVADYKSGGEFTIHIEPGNLPPLDVVLHGFEAKELSGIHDSIAPLVDAHYSNAIPHDFTVTHYGSTPTGTPPVPQVNLWTLPPFISVGWIIFKGYA